MTPEQYQQLASRTETDYVKAATRFSVTDRWDPVKLNHAAMGMCAESGEVQGLMQKYLYYGQPLDVLKLVSELGDVLWYVALMCNALDWPLEKIMEVNIEKLRVRYPDKFSEEKALERDVATEERVIADRERA